MSKTVAVVPIGASFDPLIAAQHPRYRRLIGDLGLRRLDGDTKSSKSSQLHGKMGWICLKNDMDSYNRYLGAVVGIEIANVARLCM